jgi:hypothetical protein
MAEEIWPGFKRIIREFIDLEFDIYKYHSRELPFAKKLKNTASYGTLFNTAVNITGSGILFYNNSVAIRSCYATYNISISCLILIKK